MAKQNLKCVFIKREYFEKNSEFIEMLDPTDITKQTERKYIFLEYKYGDNTLMIPLRSQMPNLNKIGQVGYKIPSDNRPNAGLDYRKLLIVNDDEFIEYPDEEKIPKSQKIMIESNSTKIQNQVKQYIDGYIKAFNKGRHQIDKKYIYSTLHNFHEELKLKSIIRLYDNKITELEVATDITKEAEQQVLQQTK